MPVPQLFADTTDPLKQKVQKKIEALWSSSYSRTAHHRFQIPNLTEQQLRDLATLCTNEQSVAEVHKVLLHKLPKTDIHVHAEAGFLMDIDLARELARRNGCRFPEELVDKANNRWLYRGKENFDIFLQDFRTISELIHTPKDIEDLMYAFYKYCYEHNVIFALPGISWVQCQDKMDFVEFNNAYNAGLARGIKEFGQTTICRLRYYQERHVDTQLFEKIRSLLQAHPNPMIMTIGLAGGENGFPFSMFKKYYVDDRANRQVPNNQWYFLTAHMEEYSTPPQIVAAAEVLDWMAHGRHIADDEKCLEEMARIGQLFESCPLSDQACCPDQVPSVDKHWQLRKLLDRGLVSLNSDDQGFFGGVAEVYAEVFKKLPASFVELLNCTLNGVSHASQRSLLDMKQYQPEQFAKYMDIVTLGLLKIEFFCQYAALLPHLVKLADLQLQKDLFTIDLKTSVANLNGLLARIPAEQQELVESLRILAALQEANVNLTAKVTQRTLQGIEQFTTNTQKFDYQPDQKYSSLMGFQ
ncbi:MAG: hypothetical protein EPN84_02170 [Legionella sp.]|nr:MAG: hypothetical protein EPN84_02170 [Legionella sp.]